jgi:hypothetical protein
MRSLLLLLRWRERTRFDALCGGRQRSSAAAAAVAAAAAAAATAATTAAAMLLPRAHAWCVELSAAARILWLLQRRGAATGRAGADSAHEPDAVLLREACARVAAAQAWLSACWQRVAGAADMGGRQPPPPRSLAVEAPCIEGGGGSGGDAADGGSAPMQPTSLWGSVESWLATPLPEPEPGPTSAAAALAAAPPPLHSLACVAPWLCGGRAAEPGSLCVVVGEEEGDGGAAGADEHALAHADSPAPAPALALVPGNMVVRVPAAASPPGWSFVRRLDRSSALVVVGSTAAAASQHGWVREARLLAVST